MINRNNIDFNAYYEMNKKMAMGNEFFITLQMCMLSLIEPKEFVIICVSYMLSFIILSTVSRASARPQRLANYNFELWSHRQTFIVTFQEVLQAEVDAFENFCLKTDHQKKLLQGSVRAQRRFDGRGSSSERLM